MRRREFMALLGSATATWPLAARAQQSTMPVVGFLRNTRPEDSVDLVGAFRQGLTETGFVEGRNVAIEYRWTEGQFRSASTVGPLWVIRCISDKPRSRTCRSAHFSPPTPRPRLVRIRR
jgi:hypothetical protein